MESPLAGSGDQAFDSAYQPPLEFENNGESKEATSRTRTIEAASSRTSSIESENASTRVPRKACMDLNDAIALLDEIYSNSEVSPRTPLTLHPRNKRARSKSSDNSSNYSGERLNERFLENVRSQEKERKRPFLKKIGISMTEDRPLLTKLAPKIMGKPYLEKIGPSQAIDKPFLENIGSSKTLDTFTFESAWTGKPQHSYTSSKIASADETGKEGTSIARHNDIRRFVTGERKKSGKNILLKMYSFETEDLEESSLSMKVPHRDPLRGSSLDDVIDSVISDSTARVSESSTMTNSNPERPRINAPQALKCRVTTSEEIISSSYSLSSPMDIIHSDNKTKVSGTEPEKSLDRTVVIDKPPKSNLSVPSSPKTKVPVPGTRMQKITAVYKELDRVRSNRQISEDILDKRKTRHDEFKRRGASSDNLTKERVATPVFMEIQGRGSGKDSMSDVASVISSAGSSVKQLHDRFESQEIFIESYAEFKRRTQTNFHTANALRRVILREKNISPPTIGRNFDNLNSDVKPKSESTSKFRSKSVENKRESCSSSNNRSVEAQVQTRARIRSVLHKQQGVDHSYYSNDQVGSVEEDLAQRKKIIQNPSQETLDLLAELQKVKSLLLKVPSVDKAKKVEEAGQSRVLFPKRILLTDKEFCLSVERENSVREAWRSNAIEKKQQQQQSSSSPKGSLQSPQDKERLEEKVIVGPALFEKHCLSLDYADDDSKDRVSQKSNSRVTKGTDVGLPNKDTWKGSLEDKPIIGISVGKEVKKIESELRSAKKDQAYETIKSSMRQLGEAELKRPESEQNDTSQSSGSGIPRPREKIETSELERERRGDKFPDNTDTLIKQGTNCHSEHVNANRELQISPRRKSQSQGNPGSDSFEINSPKTSPFRMKKRLGRISIEESVKQESFASNKVDCKEVTVQKRTKCLPL